MKCEARNWMSAETRPEQNLVGQIGSRQGWETLMCHIQFNSAHRSASTYAFTSPDTEVSFAN